MELFHGNRLVKLGRKMRSVSERNFYIGTWFDGNNDGITEFFQEVGIKPKVSIRDTQIISCGTTACLLGWAASMPEFRKRGLSMEYSRKDDTFAIIVLRDEKTKRLLIQGDSVGAGEVFFGLQRLEAEYLFLPSSYYEEVVPDYRKQLRLCSEDELNKRVKIRHVLKHIRKVLCDNRFEKLAKSL